MFHMEHSALQCAIQCGLCFRQQQQRFLLNCSTWNIRFYRAAPSCLSAGFLGVPSSLSIRIVPHGTTDKALPAQKACAGAARCASHGMECKTKRFQQKEQEKTPFCIDNPHGFCYNITNVQKRLHLFSAVSFLTQFRPLPVLGRKAAF